MNTRYSSPEWKELERIQNLPCYWNQDIMTITAFMDDEQFKAHVERYRIKNEEEL
jgi:hypothetical protein